MEPVEAVLFDIDGTVCAYNRPPEEVLAVAFDEVGVDPFFAVDDYYERFSDHVADCENVVETRERCFEELAVEAGRGRDLGRTLAAVYASERDQSNVRWLPGAEEAVDRFRERYAVAAVTNGSPGMQRTKLRALDAQDRFETVVFAGFDTAAKPDPDPIHKALSILDTPPERAVKVGNSLRHDVRAAHNAGVRSVWLDRDGEGNPDPEPHVRIESMDELLAEPWA